MGLLEILAREAWTARTAWLILALAVTALVVRPIPVGLRPRLALPAYLVAGHVVAVLVAAGQRAGHYDPNTARVVALAFELFADISLAVIVLFRALLPRLGLELPRILVDIIAAIAVVIAMIAIGKRAGFSVTGLITTSAVLTAVIGFSMQDTLGNIMGGLALQLDNSVRVGDWVTLGPAQPMGRVTEIRWRYTAIETRNWETIIIPNSVLMKNPLTVLGKRSTGSELWRRVIEFTVDFRTPPTEVIAIVQEAIRTDPPPRTSMDPPPFVVFHGIRDSYALYAAVYWLRSLESDFGGDSDIRIRIYYALHRAGLRFSIPAQAVFVTQESSERESRKHSEELDRRVSALQRVDLFRPVPTDLRRRLAGDMTYAPFARGEAVTREGATGDDGLYVIVRGNASVRLGGLAGREVAELASGDFFGEMSLMTGERRSATVVATSDLECYRVDKGAFEHILREHPAIAGEVAQVLAERRAALAAVKDELDDVRRRRLETEKENLLGRIRGFFGLFDDDGAS